MFSVSQETSYFLQPRYADNLTKTISFSGPNCIVLTRPYCIYPLDFECALRFALNLAPPTHIKAFVNCMLVTMPKTQVLKSPTEIIKMQKGEKGRMRAVRTRRYSTIGTRMLDRRSLPSAEDLINKKKKNKKGKECFF